MLEGMICALVRGCGDEDRIASCDFSYTFTGVFSNLSPLLSKTLIPLLLPFIIIAWFIGLTALLPEII